MVKRGWSVSRQYSSPNYPRKVKTKTKEQSDDQLVAGVIWAGRFITNMILGLTGAGLILGIGFLCCLGAYIFFSLVM